MRVKKNFGKIGFFKAFEKTKKNVVRRKSDGNNFFHKFNDNYLNFIDFSLI